MCVRGLKKTLAHRRWPIFNLFKSAKTPIGRHLSQGVFPKHMSRNMKLITQHEDLCVQIRFVIALKNICYFKNLKSGLLKNLKPVTKFVSDILRKRDDKIGKYKNPETHTNIPKFTV